MIARGNDDNSGAIVPRPSNHLPTSRNQNESRDGVRIVRNSLCHSCQSVHRSGNFGADGGIETGPWIRHLLRRGGSRPALGDFGVLREVGGKPVPALIRGMRVGHDVTDRRQRRPRSNVKIELHRNDDLANDLQTTQGSESVQGRAHTTLDGVLNGNQRRLDVAVDNSLQCGANRHIGASVDVAESLECLMGESACGAEISVHAVRLSTWSSQWPRLRQAGTSRSRSRSWTPPHAGSSGLVHCGAGRSRASSRRSRYSARSTSVTPRLTKCGVLHCTSSNLEPSSHTNLNRAVLEASRPCRGSWNIDSPLNSPPTLTP